MGVYIISNEKIQTLEYSRERADSLLFSAAIF